VPCAAHATNQIGVTRNELRRQLEKAAEA